MLEFGKNGQRRISIFENRFAAYTKLNRWIQSHDSSPSLIGCIERRNVKTIQLSLDSKQSFYIITNPGQILFFLQIDFPSIGNFGYDLLKSAVLFPFQLDNIEN